MVRLFREVDPAVPDIEAEKRGVVPERPEESGSKTSLELDEALVAGLRE